MKTLKRIKQDIEILKSEILDNIKNIILKQEGEYLEIQGNRGSLVIGGDDQESVVIMSIETRGKYLTANYGVYDPEGYEHIEEYSIERLADILEACEEANKE
jgi:hypothetical protein